MKDLSKLFCVSLLQRFYNVLMQQRKIQKKRAVHNKKKKEKENHF